jgi:hypothetical protein
VALSASGESKLGEDWLATDPIWPIVNVCG